MEEVKAVVKEEARQQVESVILLGVSLGAAVMIATVMEAEAVEVVEAEEEEV